MSMAELMESITDELTEQMEHDVSQRETKLENEMSLVEFAEKIAPFPLSDLQKELLRKYEEECTKGNDVVLVQASNSARNTVETFNAGISSNTGTTVDTLTSFRTTITDNIAPASSDIENIGKNIVDGISNGMNLRLKSLGETTSKIANTIVETTRSKLDIHSPSKVMKALGNYTTEGYLIGLNNKVGDVKSALSNMVEPVTMEPVSARKFVAREKVAMASITAPRNTVSTDAIMQGFMEEMKPAITEAVFEAMMANSNSSTGEKNAPTVEVTLKADNETLYKMVKKGKESYNRRYHIVEDMG